MKGGTVDTDGMAMLAGKAPMAHDPGRPQRTPLVRNPVPWADHAKALAACGRSSEVIEQLLGEVRFHAPGSAFIGPAEAHRRYLRMLTGAV